MLKNCFVACESALCYINLRMLTYAEVQFPMMCPQNLDVHTVYVNSGQVLVLGCLRTTLDTQISLI